MPFLKGGDIEVSSDIEFKLYDNSDKVLKELGEKINIALEMVGQQAERNAKMLCPVDTGLLRNSIAHAVAGEQPSIGSSYQGTAKKARTYEASSPNSKGEVKKGTYSKKMPKQGDEHSVYIGTNVSYSIPVETGHVMPGGGHVSPKPFIRPAVENHGNEYKTIVEKVMKSK